MRVFIIFSFFLMSTFNICAQTTVGNIPGKLMDMNTVPGGMVTEIKFSDPVTVGNSYLDDEWHVGNIDLYTGQSIKNFPLKYDMANNHFEIMASGEIKSLSGSRVEKFTWTDALGYRRSFINVNEFKSGKNGKVGFIESIYGDEWELLELSYTELIEGTYNAVLDIGDRDNKIVKKSDYYLGKGGDLYFVERNKKKFTKQFSDSGKLYSFLKENNINLKNEVDLKNLVDFLNSRN